MDSPITATEWRFVTDAGEVLARSDAVFPIVRHEEDAISIIGTGFYISNNGVFVSAKHCFEDCGVIASQNPFSIIHFREDNQYLMRPILRSWHSSRADVFVGVAAPMRETATGDQLVNRLMTLARIMHDGHRCAA